MKNPSLRQTLTELKKAKSLAEGFTAAALLINQTAYKTGKMLYGINEKPAKAEPTPAPQTDMTIEPILSPIDSSSDIQKKQVSAQSRQNKIEQENKKTEHLSKNLVHFDVELRDLRHEYETAQTSEDKNALRFKILRVERQRREYLSKAL